MFRVVSLTFVLALGFLLPPAEAKIAVQNSQFGFSFELPLGFRELPKNVSTPEGIVATYAHPPLPRQPPITVIVTRLHGTLENPPAPMHFKVPDGQTVEYQQETWKSYTLPVARMAGLVDGANTVTLHVQLPLAPEAMLLAVNGPALQERKIESTLQMILSTLEAQATWPQGAAGVSDGAQPAKVVPVLRNGKHATSVATQAKPLKAPVPPAPLATAEARPSKGAPWWLILVCVPLMIVYIWARVVRIRRAVPSSRGRYAVVLAGGGGIALAAGTDAVSFGGGGGALGAVIFGLLIIAFAAWRIVVLPASTPAPAGPAAPVPQGPIMVGGSDLRKMSDLQIRGLGLLFLVVAGFGVHWSIIEPLHEAAEHRESISYAEAVTLFIPYLAAFSLLLLTMGKRALAVAGWRQSANPALRTAVISLLIFLGLLGVALLVGLKVTLHSMGYMR